MEYKNIFLVNRKLSNVMISSTLMIFEKERVMDSSAPKVEVKPVTTVSETTLELKRTAKKLTELNATCKDGVCTLNWKPRRPESAA